MRIALVAARFVNGDIRHNLSQAWRWSRAAKQAGADLLCFGEAFLQGFDGFVWEYEKDRDMAISTSGPVFQELKDISRQSGIDLMMGFLEIEGETLYSSCALMAAGGLSQLYRRISRGWKEYSRTDAHYQEGSEVKPFAYRGRRCLMALCGDLWDAPERFRGAELLLWPVYVNISREEWGASLMEEYAQQVKELAPDVLMINSLSENPDAFGGCCWFSEGRAQASLAMGTEGLLMVDI